MLQKLIGVLIILLATSVFAEPGPFIDKTNKAPAMLDKYRYGFDSLDPFNLDNILSCTNSRSENPTLKALQEVDLTKCYRNRLNPLTNKNIPEKELLLQDLKICNCFEKSQNSFIQSILKEPTRAQPVSDEQDLTIDNKALSITEKIQDASFLDLARSTSKASTIVVYSSLMGGPISGVMKNFYDEVNKLQKPGIPTSATTQSESSNAAPSLSDSAKRYKENDFIPGQCISPLWYYDKKSLPTIPSIINDLKDEKFNQKKWDYKKLTKDYESLMKLTTTEKEKRKDEIMGLKAKLHFLHLNPFVKYIFSSDDSKAEEYKNGMYSILRIWAKPECLEPKNFDRCGEEFIKRREEFISPEINLKRASDIVKIKNQEIEIETELLKNKSQKISQSGIIQTYLAIHNSKYSTESLPSPNKCNAESKNVIQCVKAFGGYCKLLMPLKDDIQAMKNESPDISDNLDALVENSRNLDPRTNEEFMQFNEIACNEQRYRKGIRGAETKNFFQFRDEYCKRNPLKDECKIKSNENQIKIFQLFTKEFPIDKEYFVNFSGAFKNEVFSAALNSRNVGFGLRASEEDIQKISSGFYDRKTPGDLFRSIQSSTDTSSDESVRSFNSMTSGTKSFENPNPKQGYLPNGSNEYADYNASSFKPTASAPAPRKIEDMSAEDRKEVLKDWQADYENWKKSLGDKPSAEALAKDKKYQNEIATLKSLLAQQQALNASQYKMLNDALAAKSLDKKTAPDELNTKSEAKKSSLQSSPLFKNEDFTAARSPSSIKEVSGDSANTSSRSSLGSSSASSKSGAARVAVNSQKSSDEQAVLREEAKLVNLRRNTDGTITIESSALSGTANAITLNVSDEQYKIIQANPSSLNLVQIEKNIPKEQLSVLEKKGEITLLLSNGSNPPFEVKVERGKKGLVYSLKDKDGQDQEPVRRVFTRQALTQELELR